MSKPTLIYFAIPGRAFTTRVCFAMAGIEFEDKRIAYPELVEMRTANPEKFPTGQVPVLIIGDEWITQSGAHYRYAGKLAKLYPEDPLEALRVDELLEVVSEMLTKSPAATDADEKKRLREEYAKGTLANLSAFVDRRIGDKTFATGEKMTIVDLVLTSVDILLQSGMFDHIDPNYFDAYPSIRRVINSVKEVDAVKPYLK